MTLRTPTRPIGALMESLVAPSLPFRAPLGLEIWASDRNLGPTPYFFSRGPQRLCPALGDDDDILFSPVFKFIVPSPFFFYRY